MENEHEVEQVETLYTVDELDQIVMNETADLRSELERVSNERDDAMESLNSIIPYAERLMASAEDLLVFKEQATRLVTDARPLLEHLMEVGDLTGIDLLKVMIAHFKPIQP